MKQKNSNTKVVILFVTLVVLLITAVYLRYEREVNKVAEVQRPRRSAPLYTPEPTPTPTPFPTATEEELKARAKAEVEAIKNAEILTYTDTKAGFSIEYLDPTSYGGAVRAEEGERVSLGAIAVTTHYDYNGGSRRDWLFQHLKYDLSEAGYELTYEDVNVDGANALLIQAIDPGSIGATYVVIPKGNKVFLVFGTSSRIDSDSMKKFLSTFKFL